MCISSAGAAAYIASTRSPPTICFCTANPFSARVSGVVVAWPSSGSEMPRSVRTSLVACRKSNTLPMPTYGTAWYTISLTCTGVTPTVSAAPSITRYPPSPCTAMRAASCTMSRERGSRLPWWRTSSKAKLSKTSMSSGSVTVRVDTCPGNSASWFLRACSLGATVRPSGGRYESDRDRDGLVADDGADDGRAVPVVLGVVGRVDGRVHVGIGGAEGDVALDPAGADAPGAGGLRAAVPGVVGPVGGAHVQFVTDADG